MSFVLRSLAYALLLFSVSYSTVFALTTPTFPSCLNPQGSVKASYETGSHGIVGSTNEYSGKDAVYSLDNGNNLQCFCASNGEGIQTNWIKASVLSSDDLKVLKNTGWTFIPDGALWGLDHVPYLAQNSSFSCLGSSNSGGGSTKKSASNGSSNSSSTSSSPAQAVLGAATTLANTGNLKSIVYITLLGLGTLFVALLLKRFSK